MSGESRKAAEIFGGHLGVGIVVGTLFGFAYFVLEPLVEYAGRYDALGATLPRILGVYLLFGLAAGALSGIAGGVVGAVFGRRWGPDRLGPVYAAFFAGVLVFMYAVRHYSRTRFQRILTSPDALKFIGILALLVAAGIVASKVLDRKRLLGRMGRRTGLGVVLACVVLVAGVQGFAVYRENLPPGGRPAAAADGPNVMLILLDALRADHVGAYGYARETTPTIDRLAKDGVLFLNARSHGNRTIISVPSIFTSLYPSFHGTIGRGVVMRPLAEEHTTIAEVFHARGYATVGLMSNIYLKKGYGLGQGFDALERFYSDRYLLGLYKLLRHLRVIERPKYAVALHPDAQEVTDRGVHRLRTLRGRPFFIYAHYMDTHHPYNPPAPYDTMFVERGSMGPLPLDLFRKTTRALRGTAADSLSAIEIQRLKDYYDGSIRYADDQIARLVDEARRVSGRRGLVIVVTSDHGDEFFEHGRFHHENLLIEQLIRVPLVFWSTEGFARGSKITSLVRHVDILPTLADLIGAQTPSEAMGRSLVPLLRGEPDTVHVDSYAEGDFCTALTSDGWKIEMVDSTGTFHLFHVAVDPLEKEDLAATAPAVFDGMRTRLSEYMKEAKAARDAAAATGTQVDEETVRKLRALGYIK
jgi:arylsulfatase A-like enzyme